MSKYFSLFQTEAQYQEALTTLDYPNVSLIDSTGDLHYSVFNGKEVLDAPFGSILMAEESTGKMFYILPSEYTLDEYPLATFKPIAVCIFDKESNANDEAVFLSTQWMTYYQLGYGSPYMTSMTWGFNNILLSSKVTGIDDTGTNHISSKIINDAMKPWVTKDYSGSSITDTYEDGESTSFCCCWRFSTPGTSEGDWMLPSYYDLSKYKLDASTVNSAFQTIQNVASWGYLSQATGDIWSATEYVNDTKGMSYKFTSSTSSPNFLSNWRTDNYMLGVRAVFIPGPREV